MPCILEYQYDELEKLKGWDVLIAPNGEVLKVCERGNMDAVHDELATVYSSIKLGISINELYRNFQLTHPFYQSKNLGEKDIFINLLGYTNFEQVSNQHVEITPPNPEVAGLRITDKQFLTIQKLLKINGDNMEDLYQVFKYDKAAQENDLRYIKQK